MFQNNNKLIIKKLVRSSIKADKKRNFFVILTISFAACLMLTLALYHLGNTRETNIFLQGRYQAAIVQLDSATIEAMKDHTSVEKIGKKLDLSTLRVGDYTLNIVYEDETALNLLSSSKLNGHMPEHKRDVVVEQAYLEHVGLSNALGQQIQLDLGDGVENYYNICGILQDENESRSYQVIASYGYAESVTNGSPLYAAHIRMMDSESLSSDALKEKIQRLADEFGIAKQNVFYSSTYFGLEEENTASQITLIITAGILIVIACSIVIYSLFYISVIGKTQEYGRLRVIGTTNKQIKKIVQKEGIYLSLFAIPLGLFIGCVIGYLLVPGGWHWTTAISSTAVVALVTELSIIVAIRAPIKLAAAVSPIEAVRITSYAGTVKATKSKKLHRRITTINLATMNFTRNGKKSVLTLLSLGFTGVLLMCCSSYLNSIDVIEMARQQFPNGEFNLTLNENATNSYNVIDAYTQLQSENPLNKELKTALLSIVGVSGVETFVGCKSDFVFPNDKNTSGRFRVIGLTEQQLNQYQSHLIEGTANYNELIQKHGILISDSSELIGKYYQYNAKIGDTIQIITDKGTKEEFVVMGIMKNWDTGIDVAFFYMPDALLPQLKNTVSNFNTHYFVQADMEKIDLIETEIFKLTEQNSNIEVSTFNDIANSLQQRLDQQRNPLFGLVTFLAMFGLINLINTLMTNMISRRQEFGILQAIGLSNKQLSKMLRIECSFYILGTITITLTIGTACGVLLCSVFNQVGIFGTLTYHFPFMQLAIYFIALILIQDTFSWLSIHFYKKQSLVERIKTMEQ